MNKQTQEALKMAIKALLTGHHHTDLCNEAVNACKEALEQLAQEPVGFVVGSENYPCINVGYASITDSTLEVGTPLYTHPHQVVPTSTWQGLTDDEIEEIIGEPIDVMYSGDYESYRAIEQALKEKNHV